MFFRHRLSMKDEISIQYLPQGLQHLFGQCTYIGRLYRKGWFDRIIHEEELPPVMCESSNGNYELIPVIGIAAQKKNLLVILGYNPSNKKCLFWHEEELTEKDRMDFCSD
jgi:hypothetical protein